MRTGTDDALREFGRRVRRHRVEKRQSMRDLADQVEVSPSYIASIERGHNPSTGRPPVPSAKVIYRLTAVLGIPAEGVIGSITGAPTSVSPGGASAYPTRGHALVYDMTTTDHGTMRVVDSLHGTGVDHWLQVADPRHNSPDDLEGRATIVQWRIGRFPYEGDLLDPDDILAALDATVSDHLPFPGGSQNVGLMIADCSAVMRWAQNSEAEVALETTWHDRVSKVWTRHFDAPPAANVCVYRHEDIQALALTIDQLDTALTLLREHGQIHVVDDQGVLGGDDAVERILREHRPPGVSLSAWSDLVRYTSTALAG